MLILDINIQTILIFDEDASYEPEKIPVGRD
jgi:hypothetical protein